MVCGGFGIVDVVWDEELIVFVGVVLVFVRCVVFICSGVFVFVWLGFLEGWCVIIYWCLCEWLVIYYLIIDVDVDVIYVWDGFIWMLVGVIFGMDFVLVFVEEDWGYEMVLVVVRFCVMYMICLGG